MTGPTHRIGGIAAGTMIVAALKPEVNMAAILMSGAVLGSLLPDIDNPHSSISQKWDIVSLFVAIGQKIIRGISFLFPSKLRRYIRNLIGHRGITHSLSAAIILPLFVVILGQAVDFTEAAIYLASGLFGGILNHILLDMLAGGVPLFIPFSLKRIWLAKIDTGGVVEWLFRFLLVLVIICFGLEVILWQKL